MMKPTMFSKIKERIRGHLASRLRVPSVNACLDRLVRNGFSPTGIYDVGAYQGDFTNTVLKLWPSSVVTCFEPQTSQIPALNMVAIDNPGRVAVYNCLLGERCADCIDFHVGETASSVLSHSADKQYPTIQLPMKTLDSCRTSFANHPCALLKLDVQGYELNVLRGAAKLLEAEVEVILVEVNFLEIYAGASLMHETVAWLADKQFVAYDIGELIRRPLDDALWQADLVFVKTAAKLRSNKHWNL